MEEEIKKGQQKMRLRNRKRKRKLRERLLWAESRLPDQKGELEPLEQEQGPPLHCPAPPALLFPSALCSHSLGDGGNTPLERSCPQFQTHPWPLYNRLGSHLPPLSVSFLSSLLPEGLTKVPPKACFSSRWTAWHRVPSSCYNILHLIIPIIFAAKQ